VFRHDLIDLKIVEFLQTQGAVSNVEIASYVGLTPPPCLRRLQRLRSEGVLGKAVVQIPLAAFDLTVQVWVDITLKNKDKASLTQFEKEIQQWDLVRQAFMFNDQEYCLLIVAASWDDYHNFVHSVLLSHPNFQSMHARFVSGKPVKQEGLIPTQIFQRHYRIYR